MKKENKFDVKSLDERKAVCKDSCRCTQSLG